MLTRLIVCLRWGKLETDECRYPNLLPFLFLLVGFCHNVYGNKEGRLKGWVRLGELGGRLCALQVVQRWRIVQRCLCSVIWQSYCCLCSSRPFHVWKESQLRRLARILRKECCQPRCLVLRFVRGVDCVFWMGPSQSWREFLWQGRWLSLTWSTRGVGMVNLQNVSIRDT